MATCAGSAFSDETTVLDVTEMFWRCSAVAAEAASRARPPLSCHLVLAAELISKNSARSRPQFSE